MTNLHLRIFYYFNHPIYLNIQILVFSKNLSFHNDENYLNIY